VSSALGFILGVIVLMALVVVVLTRTLWQGAREAHEVHTPSEQEMAQANTQVYRDQLEELERDYLNGSLSQTELNAARDELARRLLEDVTPPSEAEAIASSFRKPLRWVWGLGVSLPVLAIVMYAVLGQPMALDPSVLARGAEQNAEVTPEKLATMATALMRRLQDEPNSAEGWVMLGRVQRARNLFAEADEAFGKALALTQDDDLWIERAEVLAQKNNGNFAGEPWAIIQRVLTRNPQHINALLLAGSASFAELNYRSALRFWERARDLVDPSSPDAQELDRAMAEARDKLGLPPVPARAAAPAAAGASGTVSASSISGRVSVVSELVGKVAPTDTVFVYATPVSGSKMPVAMLRTTADKLPLDFVLDDSMAMMPNVKLSGMSEVTVRVRISKSGQAKAQSGDLGVSVTPVKPGAQGLNLMVRDVLH
jgi:cytochrome c-type biogenesis protein CcmH